MSRGTASNDFANGNTRLSIIAEDENQLPVSASNPKLIRTSNRSHHRRWGDQPPRHSFEASPPKYDVWDKSQLPKRRGFFSLQSNPQIAKRGGWKRLLVLVLVLLAVMIALAVGLGVGLTRRNSSSSSPAPSHTPLPFPLGAYAINTYLTSVLTSCTSNPATFSCYPYTTYNSTSSSSSPSGAMATFDWIISSPTNTTSNLSISTSQNPFANTFSDVPLTLQNPGQESEHYAFSLPLMKIVVPNTPISSDGASANCYYNSTTFQAELYTKRPYQNITGMAGPTNGTSGTGNSTQSSQGNGDWKPWPFAVNVMQTVHGGAGVPECFEFTNQGQTGPEIGGLTPQPAGSTCECAWMNFDLS